MTFKNLKRLFAALAKDGLDVSWDAGIYKVRLKSEPNAPIAEIVLPDDFPVEAKALKQLANLAAVSHPDGGKVLRACASPDFHPGDSGVAIGSVIETESIIVPAAIGTDINCGMRLHSTDIKIDQFLANRDKFVASMKGDYLLGTRDLPMSKDSMQGMFNFGLLGWHEATKGKALGSLKQSNFNQLLNDIELVYLNGTLTGNTRWAPDDLVEGYETIRDGDLGTIGGGNHFVEIQYIEEILDPVEAWERGLRKGYITFMIHSGSRGVGMHIGTNWKDKARKAWPSGVKYPESALFPLSNKSDPELFNQYLEAEATASNYAFMNRLLLAELMRGRLREIFDADLEARLVADIPHNITLQENNKWIARKGACPAHKDMPVIIPGSMGDPSFYLLGKGNDHFLCSASHGAGRAHARFDMGRDGANKDEDHLRLRGVDCITLREERRIEEAPAAYKPIQPVIDCQVAHGTVKPVAKMQPILTFKC